MMATGTGWSPGPAAWKDDLTPMAAGEWISVSAQNELVEREVAVERRELAGNTVAETAELAAEIDARIEQAWAGHPNRKFIESGDDFIGKAQKAMEAIKAALPPCCREHKIKEFEKT